MLVLVNHLRKDKKCTPIDLILASRMCLATSLQRLSAAEQIAMESASCVRPVGKRLRMEVASPTSRAALTKSWECSPLVVIQSRGDNNLREESAIDLR